MGSADGLPRGLIQGLHGVIQPLLLTQGQHGFQRAFDIHPATFGALLQHGHALALGVERLLQQALAGGQRAVALGQGHQGHLHRIPQPAITAALEVVAQAKDLA